MRQGLVHGHGREGRVGLGGAGQWAGGWQRAGLRGRQGAAPIHADVHEVMFTPAGTMYVATDGGIVLVEKGHGSTKLGLLVPCALDGVNPALPDFVVGIGSGSTFGGMGMHDQSNLAVSASPGAKQGGPQQNNRIQPWNMHPKPWGKRNQWWSRTKHSH